MIPAEIFKKVKQIEIRTNRIVDSLLGGEYHSAFKGRGMEFEEVREYQIGDEVRTIDWNVTARQGSPYVKVYREERELQVFLIVDVSPSEIFGTSGQYKNELAAEFAALIAFAAIRNNDKVGLILFGDKVELYVPPKKGRKHVLRVIRHLLTHRPQSRGTDIAGALDFFAKVARRRCTVFLVSDFIAEGYEKNLAAVRAKHDLIAVRTMDPREVSFPKIGLIALEDAETGEVVFVDTRNKKIRELFSLRSVQEENKTRNLFKSLKVDELTITTGKPYIRELSNLFRVREKRLYR